MAALYEDRTILAHAVPRCRGQKLRQRMPVSGYPLS